MTKIIIAVPNQQMYDQACRILADTKTDALVLRTSSGTVVDDVAKAAEGGGAVVVARGHHAQLLKKYTVLPLVEIMLSGQEVALLIRKALLASKKPRPVIAFIGYSSMFGDLAPFSDIFDVTLWTYCADGEEPIPALVDRALGDGADMVIGGEIAVARARELHAAALFLESTAESIAMALRSALRVRYGIDTEKRKSAEMMALLNYSFDAVLILDTAGRVTMTNHVAERIFGIPDRELMGRHIFELLEAGPGSALFDALGKKKDIYAAVAMTKQEAFFANLAVLRYSGGDEGFILSLQAFKRIEEMEETVRLERVRMGYVAEGTFDGLPGASSAMEEVKREAKLYAQYDLPLLITGDFGTPGSALAQAVHNAGNRRKSPFVSLDLGRITGEMQPLRLCGTQGEFLQKGAVELAHRGTLLIENVDLLTPQGQYLLLQLADKGLLMHPDGRMRLPVDVRLICVTHRDLRAMAGEGRFSWPLYYALARTLLRIPPLRARPEDIPLLTAAHLKRLASAYHKPVSLTPEAQALLNAHPWEGNELALSLFLERLVILSGELTAKADFVRRQLDLEGFSQKSADAVPAAAAGEEAEILAALLACRGSRAECARRLGISTTTLWRKMKKHGIA